MSNNTNLRPINSTLLLNKIKELSIKFNELNQSKQGQTREDLIIEASKFLSTFFAGLSRPIFNPNPAMPDHIPDLVDYNDSLKNLSSDMNILFSELENIESLELGNFNFMVTDTNKLMSRLKTVFSKLGDYILFINDPTRDVIYFSDSFNNTSRIDFNSTLLNSTQCEIDQMQGIVTLPIDNDKVVPFTIDIAPVINTNSNGLVGNNYEAGRELYNDITKILDNNADTWFEYEKIATIEDDSLILDITLNLSDPKIINYIRINPNNFGTQTGILIDTIDTSIDGKVYTSIKDDIPINGFAVEDEENIFSLSPSSSKYAGQGVYSFTPRKCKYIHLVFRQNNTYSIIDKNDQSIKLRYAIGIRDIEVANLVYKNTGELVSTVYQTENEIRKVALVVNQNPIEDSELATIEHFISHDNGATWTAIKPNLDILNFNTVDSNSINTATPVTTLRYKTILTRNDKAFDSNSSNLNKTIQSTSELHPIPSASPYSIELTEIPVPSSIVAIDPFFGSRGVDSVRYTIGAGTNSSLTTILPFNKIKRDLIKELNGSNWRLVETGPEEIRINGELWTKSKLASAGPTDKIYEINYEDGIVRTGNNENGKAIPGGASIDIKFTPERIYPSATGTTENTPIGDPNARNAGRSFAVSTRGRHNTIGARTRINMMGINTSGDKVSNSGRHGTSGIRTPSTARHASYGVDSAISTTVFLDEPHIAKLQYPTSNDKSNFTIKRYGQIKETTEILKPGVSTHRLANASIVEDTISFSDIGIFSSEQTFINGEDELSSPGHYSIDLTNGILYSYDPISSLDITTITYSYQPIVTLALDQWDFATSTEMRDSISIKSEAFKSISVLEEPIPTNVKYSVVENFALVKGTVKFSNATIFKKEVDFIDGRKELNNYIQVTDNLTDITDTTTGTKTIVLRMAIVNDTSYETVFSNKTVFATLVGSSGAVTSIGKYYIDRSTHTVYVYTAGATTNLGTIQYYYSDPLRSNAGFYSVNYPTGEIYTVSTTVAGITTDYDYTHYEASYLIARRVDPADITFDVPSNSVILKDKEVQKKLQLISTTNNLYQITYDFMKENREAFAELKSYFTPVLKDYAIKIITKDVLLF